MRDFSKSSRHILFWIHYREVNYDPRKGILDKIYNVVLCDSTNYKLMT